jgi:hypothetical protein
VFGTYEVDPDGHMTIEIDEFPIEAMGERDNSVTMECYIVQPQQLARCIQHTLITFQQGPDPKPLPLSMIGSLERQR